MEIEESNPNKPEKSNTLYKVVGIDNLDRDHISDLRRPLDEDLSKEDAEERAKELNYRSGEYGQWYYIVKPQDYELYDAYENLP